MRTMETQGLPEDQVCNSVCSPDLSLGRHIGHPKFACCPGRLVRAVGRATGCRPRRHRMSRCRWLAALLMTTDQPYQVKQGRLGM